MTTITVIGLGEAGGRYATGLVSAGHRVLGSDPGPPPTPEGVERVSDLHEAVSRSDVIIVLTAASLSARVAASVAPALTDQHVYADFTSASPAVIRDVAEVVEATGAAFVDVAILSPMTVKGAQADVIVSGPKAASIGELLSALGAHIELLGDRPGDATAHKLLRSSFMKPLASIVSEAVIAGRAAGVEDWVRGQIIAQLTGGEAFIDRNLAGSVTHAERRAHEMASVVEFLNGLGVPSEMSEASRHTLLRLQERGHQG